MNVLTDYAGATKVLALCADGYGHAAAADAAVLSLAAQRRLSDVSCQVNDARWPQAARELSALPTVRQGRVRTGLHFNLTQGRPLSPELQVLWPQFPDLQRLMVMAHLRRLPLAALQGELQAQLQAFEQARGRAPAHLAGHQHVHHLPGVRELVLAQLAGRADIRVRHTGRVQGPGKAVQRLLLEGSGGRELGRALEAAQRHANTHLFGLHDPTRDDFRSLMQHWLAAAPALGGLVVFDPAAEENPGPEVRYLASDAFAADLQAAAVRLG